MTDRRTLLAGGLALAALPTRAWSATAPLVRAPAGDFEGDRVSGVQRFLGIQYGRGPRFQAPVLIATLGVLRPAHAFGPVCPQRGPYGPQAEECLFLNIWTPDANLTAQRPVMVYIHGGAYSNGSVTDPLNDGAVLAARGDVVVVTINHRLNALGYLYLARLDPRFPDSGNAGQLDLILALRWLRGNIANFGGNPKKVMLFGQSGGGAKIATLMGTPAADGLFHAVATMSGQQVTASGPINATRRARAYLAGVGVKESDLSPLLGLPTERLVEGLKATDPILGGSIYFGPVLDMKWLHRHPFWPDANPQSLAVPMILGNTRDETKAFISPESEKVRGLSWDNLAERMAPELKIDLLPDWVVTRYREHFPHDSPTDIFYRATTAGRSWPGQVIEADARAAVKASATWVYQLDFQSPVQPERGAPHTSDIPLVFGTLSAAGSISGVGPASQRLSRQMMAAFVNLARGGDPNGAGVPDWPVYALPNRATMVFDLESRAVADPRKWERELFARAPYIQPGS